MPRFRDAGCKLADMAASVAAGPAVPIIAMMTIRSSILERAKAGALGPN